MSRVIDGDVLTEWISGECKSPSCPKNESAFGMRIMKHIERMPTIEPEHKPGHWILGGYDDMYYVCDQCGYKRSDYYAKPKAKYCENCGVRMEEPEDIPMEYFESGGR